MCTSLRCVTRTICRVYLSHCAHWLLATSVHFPPASCMCPPCASPAICLFCACLLAFAAGNGGEGGGGARSGGALGGFGALGGILGDQGISDMTSHTHGHACSPQRCARSLERGPSHPGCGCIRTHAAIRAQAPHARSCASSTRAQVRT